MRYAPTYLVGHLGRTTIGSTRNVFAMVLASICAGMDALRASNRRVGPLWARTFCRDAAGNVAMMFALVSVPFVTLVGAAVDYGRGSQAKVELQAATDAALLNEARAARGGTDMAKIGASIQSFVRNVTGDQNATVVGNPTISPDRTSLCVDVTTTAPAMFMKIAGIDTLTVQSHGCTEFSLVYFEIALVIDNSGSMANSSNSGTTKMAAAKTAATNLVNTMTSSPSFKSSFSLVPFSAAVNIGKTYQTASFMDRYGKSATHWSHFKLPAGAPWLPTSKFDLISGMGATWTGCVEERPNPYMTTDTKADSAISPDTLFVPYLYPDGSDVSGHSNNDYLDDNPSICGATQNPKSTYNVADGQTTLHNGQSKVCKYNGTKQNSTTSAYGSSFPAGPNLLCSSTALTPLTTDTSDTTGVKKAITAMTALGDTNLLSGVMWGWRTISPNGPFGALASNVSVGPQTPKPYSYRSPDGAPNQKVIVLLTDGDNHWGGQGSEAYSDDNKSAYSAVGFFWENRLGGSSNPTTPANAYSQMNAATLQACTNAKKAGITIYTVGFTASDGISAAGQKLLADCASDSSKAFVAANGTALNDAFKKIADSMSVLRLSQ
jgi:Flp pilus assembly protein TadG